MRMSMTRLTELSWLLIWTPASKRSAVCIVPPKPSTVLLIVLPSRPIFSATAWSSMLAVAPLSSKALTSVSLPLGPTSVTGTIRITYLVVGET